VQETTDWFIMSAEIGSGSALQHPGVARLIVRSRPGFNSRRAGGERFGQAQLIQSAFSSFRQRRGVADCPFS
jgi:hypothetical protein